MRRTFIEKVLLQRFAVGRAICTPQHGAVQRNGDGRRAVDNTSSRAQRRCGICHIECGVLFASTCRHRRELERDTTRCARAGAPRRPQRHAAPRLPPHHGARTHARHSSRPLLPAQCKACGASATARPSPAASAWAQACGPARRQAKPATSMAVDWSSASKSSTSEELELRRRSTSA